MHGARRVLIGTLILLFFGLSFNAYACLVPLFGATDASMNGCSSGEEQPARQFCDTFKTLGIESLQYSPHLYLSATQYPEFLCPAEVPLLIDRVLTSSHRGPHRFIESSSQDVLLKTTVLRI